MLGSGFEAGCCGSCIYAGCGEDGEGLAEAVDLTRGLGEVGEGIGVGTVADGVGVSVGVGAVFVG